MYEFGGTDKFNVARKRRQGSSREVGRASSEDQDPLKRSVALAKLADFVSIR